MDIYIQGRPFERQRDCTTCRDNTSTGLIKYERLPSVYTISHLSLLSCEKIEGRMRREATGATNKSRHFSDENSPERWTDCKFFSETSFLNKIRTIFKSIDVLQITRFIFVKLKSQLTKVRFSNGEIYFESLHIKFVLNNDYF